MAFVVLSKGQECRGVAHWEASVHREMVARRVTAVHLSASVHTKAAWRGALLHVRSEALDVQIIIHGFLALWIIVCEHISRVSACIIHGSAHSQS